MNKKLLVLTLILIIAGIIIGYLWQSGLYNNKTYIPEVQNQLNQNLLTPTTISSVTLIPTPTYPPYSLQISDIDETFIYVKNQKGSVRLSKSKVKVFKRSGDQLNPATLNDLRIGQNLTENVIEARKESHIIIES
mgnify:CR=1 FL=1